MIVAGTATFCKGKLQVKDRYPPAWHRIFYARPMDLVEVLAPLEKRLLAMGDDCDRACVESLLAEDFREVSASGREWDRVSMLRELVGMPLRRHRTIEFRCTALADDMALLNYRTVVNGRETLRVSLWVLRAGRWQMLYHQGTLVPPKEAPTGS